MRLRQLFMFLSVCLALSSCEKAFLDDDPNQGRKSSFSSLWGTVNEKYTFLEYKRIDWDSVYTLYEPLINDEMNDYQFFDLLSNVLGTLRDGHVNLKAPFNLTRNWDVFLDRPPNFNWDVIERNYLEEDHMIIGPFRFKVIDGIGYVYYSSFAASFEAIQLEYLEANLQPLKGVIFDIRNNGGGSLSNANQLAELFADKERTVFREYIKTGPGSKDFELRREPTISPRENGNYSKPVVLLTNRSSYSASTFFATMMSNFPHVTIVGDTTGGGGGLPSDYQLPNGWTYRISTTATYDMTGFNVEDGFPPHVAMNLDTTQMLLGRDNILDYAIGFLQ